MEHRQYVNAFGPGQSKHELKEGKDEKQNWVKFQMEFIAIITQLINLPHDRIEDKIEQCLEIIGDLFCSDRCYLTLISDEGKVMETTYEWCAEGIEPQIKNLNGLLLDIFSWEWKVFTRHEPIHIPRVANLGSEATVEKRIFQALDIQSLLLIPLGLEGTCIGILGLEAIRSEKTWEKEEIELLRGAGEAVVTILAHRQADRTLKDFLQQIERIKMEWESTADSLSEIVFLIDNQDHIIRSNRAVEIWRLGSVMDVKGRKIHELLHPGCFDPACIFETYFLRARDRLTANNSVKWEFQDRILKRYLSVQIRRSSAIIEGKKKISFAVVTIKNITEIKTRMKEQLKLVHELQDSLSKSKLLSGLLPICASCKKIRDDKGNWNQIESYIRDRSEADFSHGICPECQRKLYPDYSH